MKSLRCRDCRGFTCSTWNIAESADVLTNFVPDEAISLKQPDEQGSRFAVGRLSLSCLNLAAIHVEVCRIAALFHVEHNFFSSLREG
jgi:hypothetical protein